MLRNIHLAIYSFSWMSALRARVGDAESAVRHLDIFVKAFIVRNGFHVNGDQTRSGYSGMTYRPFTLEGNFAALQAVHEMLLQSWSPTPGQQDTEIIRIFPAMPWRWRDATFSDLRAEGGHRVSATRENNATTWFRIVAGKDGAIRVRDNFGGRRPQWDRDGVRKTGDNFEVSLRKGESIQATLPKPRRRMSRNRWCSRRRAAFRWTPATAMTQMQGEAVATKSLVVIMVALGIRERIRWLCPCLSKSAEGQ